jgi:hypothetical protein
MAEINEQEAEVKEPELKAEEAELSDAALDGAAGGDKASSIKNPRKIPTV